MASVTPITRNETISRAQFRGNFLEWYILGGIPICALSWYWVIMVGKMIFQIEGWCHEWNTGMQINKILKIKNMHFDI